MAKIEARPLRPLSPHLMIFRPYSNMVMSILHRITGVANYFGTLFLAAWLTATAMGPDGFLAASEFAASPLGLVILFGYSWSLIHHALGGIRHLVWDTGRGYELSTIRLMSWGTIIGSLTLTGFIWFVGLAKWGAF